jgi:hypothetical protein
MYKKLYTQCTSSKICYITIGRDNRDVVEKEDDGQGRMDDVAADTVAVPNQYNTYCCNCMYYDCSVQAARNGRDGVVEGDMGNDADDRATSHQLEKVAEKLVVEQSLVVRHNA